MGKKPIYFLCAFLSTVCGQLMWAQPNPLNNHSGNAEISFLRSLDLNPYHILSPEELGLDSEEYAVLVVKAEVVLRLTQQIRALLPQAFLTLDTMVELVDLLQTLEYGIENTRGVVEGLTAEWQDRADPNDEVEDNEELDSPEIDFLNELNDGLFTLIEELGDNSVYHLRERIQALVNQGNELPSNIGTDCYIILDLIDQRFRPLMAHLNRRLALVHYANTIRAFQVDLNPSQEVFDPIVQAANQFAAEGFNVLEDFRLTHMREEQEAFPLRSNRQQNRQNRRQARDPYQRRVLPSPLQVDNAPNIHIEPIQIQLTNLGAMNPSSAVRILNNRMALGLSCASAVGGFRRL